MNAKTLVFEQLDQFSPVDNKKHNIHMHLLLLLFWERENHIKFSSTVLIPILKDTYLVLTHKKSTSRYIFIVFLGHFLFFLFYFIHPDRLRSFGICLSYLSPFSYHDRCLFDPDLFISQNFIFSLAGLYSVVYKYHNLFFYIFLI